MDYEMRKIYKALESFNMVDGISEIIADMDALSNQIGEYKTMYRLNSYNIPSIITSLESANKDITEKYDSYFKNLREPVCTYNINVFGGSDSCERKVETSISKLGKVAIMKICDYYDIEYSMDDLAGTNADTVRYFKNALDKADANILETKMSFKVAF